MRWQTTCVESSEGPGSRRSIGSRTSAGSTQQRWQTHIHRRQPPSDTKAARDCWGPAQKTMSVSQEKLMLCDNFFIFQFWPAMRQLKLQTCMVHGLHISCNETVRWEAPKATSITIARNSRFVSVSSSWLLEDLGENTASVPGFLPTRQSS